MFRFRGKSLFVTYPRCPLKKDLVGTFYMKWFAWGIVVSELHEDGTPHIHGVFGSDHKVDLYGTQLEIVSDDDVYKGNYQRTASVPSSIDYLTKYDKDPFVFGGTLESIRAKHEKGIKVKFSEAVGMKILEGVSAKRLCQEHPELMLRLKSVNEACSAVSMWRLREVPRPRFPGATCSDPTVMNWLSQWVKVDSNLPHKTPQLYLQSPPNHGKSSLIMLLDRFFHIYYCPYDQQWFDDFDDPDLIVLDEYNGQYTLQFINKFIEGVPCPLPRRGMSPYVKRRNVPVIFCSNYSPSQVYRKVDSERVDTFISRLLHVNLTRFLDAKEVIIDCSSPTPLQVACVESKALALLEQDISSFAESSLMETSALVSTSPPLSPWSAVVDIDCHVGAPVSPIHGPSSPF